MTVRDKGDSVEPVLQGKDNAIMPIELHRLPLWQQRYLGALAAGLSQEEAVIVARVTKATICDWILPGHRAYDPQFARAERQTRQGVARLGKAELKGRALAYNSVVLDDAFAESRGLDIHTGEKAQRPIVNKDGDIVGYEDGIAPRDRLGNRRLIAEMGGVVGEKEAQGGNTYVQNVAAYWAGQPPPPPLSVTPAIDVEPEPEADTPRIKQDDAG